MNRYFVTWWWIVLFVCACSCDPVPKGASKAHRTVFGWNDYNVYYSATVSRENYEDFAIKYGFTNIITPSVLQEFRADNFHFDWHYETKHHADWWNVSEEDILGSYIKKISRTSYALLTYKDGKIFEKFVKW